MHTEVLKNQQLSIITENNDKIKIQSTPITWIPAHSNCFSFPFRVEVTRVYFHMYACLFVRISSYCKPKKTMNIWNNHKKAQDLQQADPKPVTK